MLLFGILALASYIMPPLIRIFLLPTLIGILLGFVYQAELTKLSKWFIEKMV